MKKILVSFASIGVVAAMVVAATGAFFSASVTSTGNTFQTASLNIGITNTAFEKRILDGRGMYPGSFVQSSVTFKNTGDVPFNPDLALATGVGLNDKLWFEVWTDGKLWFSNWISQFPGYNPSGRVTLDKINAGEEKNVAFRLILDESAGNNYMGANYSVDLVVTGRQWNDSSYQPTTPQASGSGYVVNTWSYNVCGVRHPGKSPLLATDTYAGTGYDYTTYSPYFSYRVTETMVSNESKWALKSIPNNFYPGFSTASDGVCRLSDTYVMVTTGSDWPITDVPGPKSWFAKARSANTGFEIAVGTNDGSPAGQNTAEAAWVDGAEENFTLSYDGVGNATLTVGNRAPVTFSVGTSTVNNIGITVKAQNTGHITTAKNLKLDGIPLPIDQVVATDGATETANITIANADLNSSFNLTGTFIFDWTELTPANSPEKQAIQISVN